MHDVLGNDMTRTRACSQGYFSCRVGLKRISLTSISPGCSIANSTMRANASGQSGLTVYLKGTYYQGGLSMLNVASTSEPGLREKSGASWAATASTDVGMAPAISICFMAASSVRDDRLPVTSVTKNTL